MQNPSLTRSRIASQVDAVERMRDWKGSTDWSTRFADAAAAVESTRVERIAALDAAALARGDGAFGDVAAPSGVDECVERTASTTYVEYVDVERPMPIAARRYVALARRYGVERTRRAAIMLDARLRRTAALNAARATRTVEYVEPFTRLYSAPRPLTALDAAVELDWRLRDERRQWVETMTAASSGEGRGTVDYTPDAVNGTETRVAPRWHSTPRVAIMTAVETRNGVTCWSPVDWTPYRVDAATGARTALVSAPTATKRKRGRPTKAMVAARLAAVAGNNAEGNSA